MKKAIVTPKAPGAIGPYSQGVETESFVYTSGQLPLNPETKEMGSTIEEQTRQALENVKAVLEEGGSSMDHVVKTFVYMADLSEFAKMNGVYETFFNAPFPARSAFQVAALPLGAKIEIEAVAIKK